MTPYLANLLVLKVAREGVIEAARKTKRFSEL